MGLSVYSKFRKSGIRDINDVLLFTKDVCNVYQPLCREEKKVEHRGKLIGGFVLELPPDERDGFELDLHNNCDFVVNTPLYKSRCLSIYYTWMKSKPPSNLLGVSAILMIPIGDIIDEIYISKDGELSTSVIPINDCWGMRVYGKRLEIAIETIYYGYNMIRIKIR